MTEGKCGGFAIQKNSSRTEKFQQNIFLVAACPAVNTVTLHGVCSALDWKAIGIWRFLDISHTDMRKKEDRQKQQVKAGDGNPN